MISATLSVTREEFEVDQTYVFWWLVSLSPHLARLFPDPTHNGDLCMHFLFSPTVIDNVMNGFGKEGKALQQNGSLFFLTWKQMSFKKWVLHSFADSCGMDNHWLTARQVSL